MPDRNEDAIGRQVAQRAGFDVLQPDVGDFCRALRAADLVDRAHVLLALCLVARVRVAERLLVRLLDGEVLFFRRVAGYTRTKFVFDFDPRRYDRAELERYLLASGFSQLVLQPFFLPQQFAVPGPVRAALLGLERTGPLARAALHVRGIVFCAATPGASPG